ncbi:hypothetical protein, partial [Escherichia coli]|uniref:hypothetical protein n=1 Tax=Escherichia coli TaxID=562 RepID=UPI001BD40795
GGEGRRRRQRDIAARCGGDQGLRAPMRRQGQPEMIGLRVGLDLEIGQMLRRDLLAAAGVDPLQP